MNSLDFVLAYLELLRKIDPDAPKRAGKHFAEKMNEEILKEIMKK